MDSGAWVQEHGEWNLLQHVPVPEKHEMDVESLDEKYLTRTLLIELLAHQFAFPVQWIQTQNTLFGRIPAIERFVEFGPSKVLANIAKRTHAKKYMQRDLTIVQGRQFLACAQDTHDLQYEYEKPVDDQESTGDIATEITEVATPTDKTKSTSAVSIHNDGPPKINPKHVSMPSIADVSTTPREITCAIIATKLRKLPGNIDQSRTIKEICAGKSTLQNEILGDLALEFTSLPENAEDFAIDALTKPLELQFSGQFGKVSSMLVAKFISASMPPNFTLKRAREYVHRKWALGPMRQMSVMLLGAATASITLKSRFADLECATAFIDDIVKTYAHMEGLAIRPADETVSSGTQVEAKIDASVIKAMSEQNQKLARRQLNVIADHLKLDILDSTHICEPDDASKDLQDQIDHLTNELGETFMVGIKPRFDARKTRRYDFAWNQAREDAMRHYYQSASSSLRSCIEARSSSPMTPLEVDIASGTPISSPMDEYTHDSDLQSGGCPPAAVMVPKVRLKLIASRPRTSIRKDGSLAVRGESNAEFCIGVEYPTIIRNGLPAPEGQPFSQLQILSKVQSSWITNSAATVCFFNTINHFTSTGVSFQNKNILITGAGHQSIAEEMVRIFLKGGARVIVASSRGPNESSEHYRQLYAASCGHQSSLTVLTFNQASSQDCRDLVDHIYSVDGLNTHLDTIIPFAALSEQGVEIDAIDGKSELAHRLMLTNVIRLVGHVVRRKRQHNILCRPTQVVLPFSPNHGLFGGDGLYSASKLGLETMLERVVSESWSEAISICGTIIGWTRGTGLMQQNDIVAEMIEAHGVLTFDQKEMAANIAAVVASDLAALCEDEPLLADFSGGLARLPKLKTICDSARQKIALEAAIAKAVYEEDARDNSNNRADNQPPPPLLSPLTTLALDFPRLPDLHAELRPLSHLQGMVDLSGVVVVVGYSELGPWGNARTRWAIEMQNTLDQAACTELAWMTNMIKHFDGKDSHGSYVGWIDTQSNERVPDNEIPDRYRKRLLDNCGLRLVRPETSDAYDPENKESLQAVVIGEDLPEFETDPDSAAAFKKRHGDNVSVRSVEGSDQKKVRFKAGAHIMVPRSTNFDWSLVAGQLPTGWDPCAYGIDDDIIKQVDPITLYVLCCVAEAFLSAGITDPMEIYQFIHTSEIGNIIGSSMGGTQKTRNMYRDVYLNKYVQGDVIQETYLNTPSAWVNMLLLGSNGPIKTPVGACATGIEAIDTAYDSITSRKTKMCIVGGVDNFHEDESYGFSTMKATVNTAGELKSGRLPYEMSRPLAETRAGFVESEGCGIQILCNAELAIAMGLPIYAIVAGSAMAADKISKSVPAPGQGMLTFARETEAASKSRLLDIHWRRSCLLAELGRLRDKGCVESGKVRVQCILTPPDSPPESADGMDFEPHSPSYSETTIYKAQVKALQRLWANDLRVQNPDISPIRAALAVWGLGIDDISFVSMHGTSTKANDKNESLVVNTQMEHLQRGRIPLLAICQKSVTGHPKAPAASWMLNGCLQILSTGLIPGNRNTDNVDPTFKQFQHLVYPTAAIQARRIDAFLLNSFGFGQKGGQMIGVHPRFVLAALEHQEYDTYVGKYTKRTRYARREFVKRVFSNSIVRVVEKPQYAPEDEARVFLDPCARIAEPLTFEPKSVHPRYEDYVKDLRQSPTRSELLRRALTEAHLKAEQSITEAQNASAITTTIGIDAEDVHEFASDQTPSFIERNYTKHEQEYAQSSVDPHATFVGRWCAKEAVFKSLGITSLGAGAPLKDIEVVSNGRGKPEVRLHGDIAAQAEAQLVRSIDLSLTYTENHVVAIALTSRMQN